MTRAANGCDRRSAPCYDGAVSGRIRIGTCSGPADAALVRSVFAAHGIDVVIAAEHHAGLLCGVVGGLLSLDIWVAADDAEEAAALLHDLRERDNSSAVDSATADLAGPADADADDHDHDHDAASAETDEPSALQQLNERRRRTGVAVLLGGCITFGAAHAFTGAWRRSIAFATVELAGLAALASGYAVGGAAVAGAIVTDLIGALWRIRAAPRPGLPIARIHST